MRRRATAVAVLAALVATVLVGCGPAGDDSGIRPVTQEEAERLAVARFRNYEKEQAAFAAEVPVGDQVLALRGTVDFRAHTGIASFATDDVPAATGLLAWTAEGKALLVATDAITDPLPTEGWQAAALDPTASTLDALLRILIDLADDRPENPQLLRQNGAVWIGSDTLDDVAVDWMAATSEEGTEPRLQVALDAEGAMHAVKLRLGTANVLATVAWDPGAAPPLPGLPAELVG